MGNCGSQSFGHGKGDGDYDRDVQNLKDAELEARLAGLINKAAQPQKERNAFDLFVEENELVQVPESGASTADESSDSDDVVNALLAAEAALSGPTNEPGFDSELADRVLSRSSSTHSALANLSSRSSRASSRDLASLVAVGNLRSLTSGTAANIRSKGRRPKKPPATLCSCVPTSAHTVSRRGTASRDKTENEDRFLSQIRGCHHGREFSFFSVFDGHHGSGTSDYLSREFLSTHLCGSAYNDSGCFERDTIEETLKRACAAADEAVLRRMREQDDAKVKIKRTMSRLRWQLDDSGSTAVFVLMAPACPKRNLPPFATLGWVGDSVALLVSRSTGKVSLLNPPRTWHTMASNTAERVRVMNEDTDNLIIGDRIFGSLKLTRAFGDITGKEPAPLLTAEPTLYHFNVPDGQVAGQDDGRAVDDAASSAQRGGGSENVSTHDQCLILASDGLYDAFKGNLQRLGAIITQAAATSSTEVTAADGSRHATVQAATLANAIVDSAVAADDVTVTVVLLGEWITEAAAKDHAEPLQTSPREEAGDAIVVDENALADDGELAVDDDTRDDESKDESKDKLASLSTAELDVVTGVSESDNGPARQGSDLGDDQGSDPSEASVAAAAVHDDHDDNTSEMGGQGKDDAPAAAVAEPEAAAASPTAVPGQVESPEPAAAGTVKPAGTLDTKSTSLAPHDRGEGKAAEQESRPSPYSGAAEEPAAGGATAVSAILQDLNDDVNSGMRELPRPAMMARAY